MRVPFEEIRNHNDGGNEGISKNKNSERAAHFFWQVSSVVIARLTYVVMLWYFL